MVIYQTEYFTNIGSLNINYLIDFVEYFMDVSPIFFSFLYR